MNLDNVMGSESNSLVAILARLWLGLSVLTVGQHLFPRNRRDCALEYKTRGDGDGDEDGDGVVGIEMCQQLNSTSKDKGRSELRGV